MGFYTVNNVFITNHHAHEFSALLLPYVDMAAIWPTNNILVVGSKEIDPFNRLRISMAWVYLWLIQLLQIFSFSQRTGCWTGTHAHVFLKQVNELIVVGHQQLTSDRISQCSDVDIIRTNQVARWESIYRSVWTKWIIRLVLSYVVYTGIFIESSNSEIIGVPWVYDNWIKSDGMFVLWEWRACKELCRRAIPQIKLQ